MNQPMRPTYNLRSGWGWRNLADAALRFVWKRKWIFSRPHFAAKILNYILEDTK